jgi:glycosyltransferase involved in cell wall biosynthesis
VKILFLVTEDWYFCSHRLPIARAARDAGYDVTVVTRVRHHGSCIEAEGFRLIPLEIRRRSKNPVRELSTIRDIAAIYRNEKPDLVHQVSLKPVIYGSIAARMAPVPAIINALAGLGFVFTSERRQAKIIRGMVKLAFRWLLDRPNSYVLLQNPDDRKALVESRAVHADRTRIVRGSGVDTRRFIPSKDPCDMPVVVTLVARMLRDKGIHEFVESVRMLKSQGVQLRAVLVGSPDPENPTSIPEAQLTAWCTQGWVEWWGQCDDIPAVWSRSNIAVLPSFREGLPLSLIEAAASGRPIVTTDAPGCREIVRDGYNGLLVPVHDAGALAAAMRKLIENRDLRVAMGERGRRLVEEQFSQRIVVEQTLDLYTSLLGPRWRKNA